MGWSEPKKFGVEKFDLGIGTSFSIPELIEAGTLPATIDYTKLTKEDFIVGIIKGGSVTTDYGTLATSQSRAIAGGFTLSKSYDATKGVLTVGGRSQSIKCETQPSYSVSKTQSMTVQAWLVC